MPAVTRASTKRVDPVARANDRRRRAGLVDETQAPQEEVHPQDHRREIKASTRKRYEKAEVKRRMRLMEEGFAAGSGGIQAPLATARSVKADVRRAMNRRYRTKQEG